MKKKERRRGEGVVCRRGGEGAGVRRVIRKQ